MVTGFAKPEGLTSAEGDPIYCYSNGEKVRPMGRGLGGVTLGTVPVNFLMSPGAAKLLPSRAATAASNIPTN